MGENTDFIFEPLSETDVDEVERIEKESFSESWSRDAFTDAIGNEFHRIFCLKRKGEGENELLGYIGWAVVYGEAEITNVAIDKKFRGHGYGNVLMEKAIAVIEKEDNKNVFLEVRAGNKPAIGLYDKFGFKEIGVRKNFYRFPTEDALVMMKTIGE